MQQPQSAAIVGMGQRGIQGLCGTAARHGGPDSALFIFVDALMRRANGIDPTDYPAVYRD